MGACSAATDYAQRCGSRAYALLTCRIKRQVQQQHYMPKGMYACACAAGSPSASRRAAWTWTWALTRCCSPTWGTWGHPMLPRRRTCPWTPRSRRRTRWAPRGHCLMPPLSPRASAPRRWAALRWPARQRRRALPVGGAVSHNRLAFLTGAHARLEHALPLVCPPSVSGPATMSFFIMHLCASAASYRQS